ncbi:MAG: QueT transporter family protein [Clostridia bacterium]|nr:QueT transporter family protein [Clostridia bacterium]
MNKVKNIVYGAAIGAIYTVLTLLFSGISYGPVQFRVSEVLTVLPVFLPCAIPGLTVGCIVANLLGGFGIYDIVFGSLATLLGALGTRYFRKKPVLAALSPVVTNSLIVGSMLYFVVPDSGALLFNMASVGFGELVICLGLGLPFIHFVKKRPELLSR